MNDEIKEKYSYIKFADFETTTANTKYYKETGDSRVNLWTYTSVDDDDKPKIGVDIKSFVETIIDDVNNHNGDFICIYFHNLKFDVRYIWTYGVRNLGWKIINGTTYKRKSITKDKPKKNDELVESDDLINDYSKFNSQSLNKKIYGDDITCIKFIGKESKPNKMELHLPNGKIINFVDSLSIIPQSIEQLAKVVGMKKHNEMTLKDGFYDVEPQDNVFGYSQDYVEYAIRDCIILKTYFFDVYIPNLENQQDRLRIKPEHRLKQIPLTIAGHSIALQRAYLESNSPLSGHMDRKFIINENDEILARKFYLGGLTLFNPNELKKEYHNCCYVDINSSYPYSMTLPLPYGGVIQDENKKSKDEWKPSRTKPINPLLDINDSNQPKNGVDYLTLFHIKVKSAVIKDKHKLGLYPLQDWNKKLNFKNDTFNNFYSSACIDLINDFECYYLDKEWELMNEFYDFDFEIVNTYYLKCYPYLETYIRILYQDKCNATNPGDRNSAKLLLNSGYGKWGENPNYDITYFCANKEHQDYLIDKKEMEYSIPIKPIRSHKIGDDEKKTSKISRFEKCKYSISMTHSNSQFLNVDDDNIFPLSFKKISKDKENYNNVWIAAITTAYSRCYLLESILKCGNDIGNVLYCDTDSMILKDKSYTKNLKIDDKELGAWKVENESVIATVFGKKLYRLKDDETGKETYKLKGVSSKKASAVDALMHSSGNFIIASKLQSTPTKSGWVLINKDINLCTNPIANQMQNAKRLKESFSFASLDEIKQMRNLFNNISESFNKGEKTIVNFTMDDDIWINLKTITNEIKRIRETGYEFIVSFNKGIDITDKEIQENQFYNISEKEFKLIILNTINNFILSAEIDKVENTNLIEILQSKITAWKSMTPSKELKDKLLENTSYGVSGNLLTNVLTGGDFIDKNTKMDYWNIFSFRVFPGSDGGLDYLIKARCKSTNRTQLISWLTKNKIFNNDKESSEYLNWCCWNR